MKELSFMRDKLEKFFRASENFLAKLSDGQFMIFCLLFVFFSSICVICDGHNWGGDFSQYIAQSRAMLNDDIDSWLEKQSFIISSSTPGFSPLIYPWMTAVILLPIYSIFGLNLYVFKLTEIFLLALAWGAFFLFLRLKENSKVAAVLTTILIFNAHYIFLTDNVLSECPFLFFAFLSIFLFYRRNFSKENFTFYSFMLGATIFFAANTRSLGIALLIALFLDDFFLLWKNFSAKLNRKNFLVEKILPRSVPYITYGILSVIFSYLLPQIPIQNNTGYLVTFSLNISDIFAQMIYYAKLFGMFFLPDVRNVWSQSFDNILIYPALILWGALAIFGAVKNFSANRFLVFYIAITLAIVVCFGAHAGIRYIFGIIPFMLYFAYLGIKNFKPKKIIAVTLLVTSLIFSVTSIAIFNFGEGDNQAYTKEALETYNFINANISDDKVIYFFKPRVLYLNTNNYTYFRREDTEESLKSADFVLFTEGDYFPNLKEFVKNNPQKYSKIFGNEKFVLCQIVK